jgi:hypothetical protein
MRVAVITTGIAMQMRVAVIAMVIAMVAAMTGTLPYYTYNTCKRK